MPDPWIPSSGLGHRESVGVAQIDLLLTRRVLVEAVLHRDAHCLERADGFLAQLAGDVVGGEVEEAAVVNRHGWGARCERFEIEELDVGCDIESEASFVRSLHVAAQHLTRVARERRAVEVIDVTEDACFGDLGVSPWQDLERVGVGDGEDVGFLNAGESVDRRAVEGHAIAEGIVEFGRRDSEAL